MIVYRFTLPNDIGRVDCEAKDCGSSGVTKVTRTILLREEEARGIDRKSSPREIARRVFKENLGNGICEGCLQALMTRGFSVQYLLSSQIPRRPRETEEADQAESGPEAPRENRQK